MFNLKQSVLNLIEQRANELNPIPADGPGFGPNIKFWCANSPCYASCTGNCAGGCKGTCSRSCQGERR